MKTIIVSITIAVILILLTDTYRELCISKNEFVAIPDQIIGIGKYLITGAGGAVAGRLSGGVK